MAHQKPQLWILCFLTSFSNTLGILYSAALPSLTTYFQISPFQGQQTISLYLFGCMLGVLVYAPLANALGRKPVVYIGVGLSILGSLCCLFAIHINLFPLLLLGRGLTAFGASSCLIITNTIIADAFTHAEAKKLLSYLMTSFAVVPAIGILIGGFITEKIAWQGCFYFMMCYALFVLGITLFLPETAKDRHLGHLHIVRIAKSMARQISNGIYLLYVAIISFASIILFVFSASAPFIAESIHISADQFGLYYLIPNMGILLGGFASAKLSHQLHARRLLAIGIAIFLVCSLLMWALFGAHWINAWVLFGMPALIFFAMPMIISQGQVLAMAASEEKAYASSLMYFMMLAWTFLSVSALKFLASFAQESALPLSYALAGVLMLLFWFVTQFVDRRA